MHSDASSPTADVVAYRQQVRVSISARTICNSLFEPAFYDFGDERYLLALSAGARPTGKISKGFWEKEHVEGDDREGPAYRGDTVDRSNQV